MGQAACYPHQRKSGNVEDRQYGERALSDRRGASTRSLQDTIFVRIGHGVRPGVPGWCVVHVRMHLGAARRRGQGHGSDCHGHRKLHGIAFAKAFEHLAFLHEFEPFRVAEGLRIP